jgi:hypothetical protein
VLYYLTYSTSPSDLFFLPEPYFLRYQLDFLPHFQCHVLRGGSLGIDILPIVSKGPGRSRWNTAMIFGEIFLIKIPVTEEMKMRL